MSSSPARIGQTAKAELEQLLRQTNKDRAGRQLKTNDLGSFALNLITDEYLSELCNKAHSNRDRMELLYMKLVKDKRVTNREEFLGMLLEGKVAL